MANILEITIQAIDNASAAMEAMSGKIAQSLKGMQTQLRVAGAAFTAVGVAGLKMASDARAVNAQLGQTAITLGTTTKEMRAMTLATTDASFPIKSVAATFDLLARAGVRNKTEMMASAKAFDGLADASGSSAEVMADLLLPAFKLFGEEIPQTTAELDKFRWLTKNTLVDLDDFGTLLTRMAPYMDKLDMSMEDAIATLAALGEQGIIGTAATLKLRTAITQAAESGEDLNTVLGISQEEIEGFKTQMAGATGLIEEDSKAANEAIGIMDKLKQKWDELTLAAGSLLTPLEPIFALMTALGPVLLFFSTSMGIAAAKMGLKKAALVAHNIALLAAKVGLISTTAAVSGFGTAMLAALGPIALLVAGIGLITFGITKLVTQAKNARAQLAYLKTFQEEWNKAQAGVPNQLAEMLEAQLAFYDSQKKSGLATKEQTKYWEENREAIERYIASSRKQKETIDAVKASNDLLKTGVGATSIAIAEGTKIIDGIARSTSFYTNAEIAAAEAAGWFITKTDEATMALKRQRDATLAVNDAIDEMIKRAFYQESAAYKLGITTEDLIQMLIRSNQWTIKTRDAIEALGDRYLDANLVMRALERAGIDVSKMLEEQRGKVDGVSRSFEDMNKSVTKAAINIPQLMANIARATSAATREAAILAYQIGLLGYGSEAAYIAGQRIKEPGQPGGPPLGTRPGEIGYIAPTLQFGGVVPGGVGKPVPIIAHGGETFLGIGQRAIPEIREGSSSSLSEERNTIININVAGSVVTEHDLVESIRKVFYDIRRHNFSLEMT